MLECSSGDYFHGNCTRICDTCQVSSCTLYCHTDSAHLCTSCDERIHAKNSIASRHEHLLICTVCENAPAAPISSFFHGSSASNLYDPTVQETDEEIGQDETDSWLLLDPDNNENQDYNDFSHCRMSDEYLDLMGHTSCIEYQYNQNQPCNFYQGDNGNDCVVPEQIMETNEQQQQLKNQDFYVHLEHENSKATSSNQNVLASFLDNSIVPEATISDISNLYPIPQKERIALLPSTAADMQFQFTRMNREAKVLRYREKRKARKFEKKIRYASRKASAEIRPRVRGRFARRTNIEVEENKMFPTEKLGYGIVPSFNFNQEQKK